MRTSYELVPVALPRGWVRDWVLSLWILAFGHRLGTRQPFRWILFRELTERERMQLAAQAVERKEN